MNQLSDAPNNALLLRRGPFTLPAGRAPAGRSLDRYPTGAGWFAGFVKQWFATDADENALISSSHEESTRRRILRLSREVSHPLWRQAQPTTGR